MRTPLLPILILLAIGLVIDCYIYRRMRHAHVRRGWLWAYMLVSAIVSAGLFIVTIWPKKTVSDSTLTVMLWTLFSYLSVYAPKLPAAIILGIQQLGQRLCRRRLRGLGIAAATTGIAICGICWWGALINRFRLNVVEIEVPVENLPEAFDGYRIAQISDIHTGTFGSDTTFLSKLVDKVNSLDADIIMFTGDIVNRHSQELTPFTATLSRITAPDGVVSIMGNHDYGDYYDWASPADRLNDIAALQQMQADMGWKMLNNASMTLRRNQSDSLVIVGVENIGDPPFPVYGDLYRAYPEAASSAPKILLTHNPAHWVDSVAGNPDANFALTLSGHTHAMQVEILGYSPAVFRYKTWGGLYPDSLGRHLYVNIGAGEVGMPARIGATPEITLITLRAK